MLWEDQLFCAKKKVKLLCKDWQIIEACFKMITTHFNNVKIQSAEYSNYFWNILHFCSEGQAKNMGKCKNAIICLVRFLFWKMFQNRRNSEFAQKNHLLSTLKYLLTSKRTKCPICKMGFQLHNTSLWFLTLFLQFMKVHFILILNTWITLYNVSNFISRRDCISKILTFFFWNMILSKSAVVL